VTVSLSQFTLGITEILKRVELYFIIWRSCVLYSPVLWHSAIWCRQYASLEC